MTIKGLSSGKDKIRKMDSNIGDDITFQEILPRLPVEYLSRLKLVCKKWFNYLTNDPLFPILHLKKANTSTITLLLAPRNTIKGSSNGLVYGVCPSLTKIFVVNPFTRHTVYVPNQREQKTGLALAWDPLSPSLGFNLVSFVVLDDGRYLHGEALQFRVYSSKARRWQVSKNASEFQTPFIGYMSWTSQSIYTGKKVYWSFIRHIMWFDIEKDAAGLIRCPNQGNFISYGMDDIGECDGEVSYSRMTKDGDIEIWLLKYKDEEFEWVKKHTVELCKIMEEHWTTMFKMLCNMSDINEKTAASSLAYCQFLKPLPYLGGEEVWFSIESAFLVSQAFSFNLRTQELKLFDRVGGKCGVWCPLKATILPCPT